MGVIFGMSNSSQVGPRSGAGRFPVAGALPRLREVLERSGHRLFIAYDRESTRINDNCWYRWDTESRCTATASSNERELLKAADWDPKGWRFESSRGSGLNRKSNRVVRFST